MAGRLCTDLLYERIAPQREISTSTGQVTMAKR
jgi:hypothetical protein